MSDDDVMITVTIKMQRGSRVTCCVSGNDEVAPKAVYTLVLGMLARAQHNIFSKFAINPPPIAQETEQEATA